MLGRQLEWPGMLLLEIMCSCRVRGLPFSFTHAFDSRQSGYVLSCARVRVHALKGLVIAPVVFMHAAIVWLGVTTLWFVTYFLNVVRLDRRWHYFGCAKPVV